MRIRKVLENVKLWERGIVTNVRKLLERVERLEPPSTDNADEAIYRECQRLNSGQLVALSTFLKQAEKWGPRKFRRMLIEEWPKIMAQPPLPPRPGLFRLPKGLSLADFPPGPIPVRPDPKDPGGLPIAYLPRSRVD